MHHDEMRAAVRRATMDDIVTRLRERAVYRRNSLARKIGLLDADFIENEAANEIEYLRRQVRQLEVERDGWIRQAIGRD